MNRNHAIQHFDHFANDMIFLYEEFPSKIDFSSTRLFHHAAVTLGFDVDPEKIDFKVLYELARDYVADCKVRSLIINAELYNAFGDPSKDFGL